MNVRRMGETIKHVFFTSRSLTHSLSQPENTQRARSRCPQAIDFGFTTDRVRFYFSARRLVLTGPYAASHDLGARHIDMS